MGQPPFWPDSTHPHLALCFRFSLEYSGTCDCLTYFARDRSVARGMAEAGIALSIASVQALGKPT